MLSDERTQMIDVRAMMGWGLPAKAPRKARPAPVDAFGGPDDPRLLSNGKAHSELPYRGPRLTPGQAHKERMRRARACLCRLCALSVAPPKTYEDLARFGIETIGFAGVEACQEERRQALADAAATDTANAA